MPELPEVETVVSQLGPLVTDRKVVSLEIMDPKLGAPGEFTVAGRTVLEVRRLGKRIGMHLSGAPGDKAPVWLCFHLRMTGRLIGGTRRAGQNSRHLRARLNLDRGSVFFYDMRRFGQISCYRSLKDVLPSGIEPLSAEFTSRKLGLLLADSRQEIKPWLMRQDRLVGLGNIYTSEILFAAGIDPRRKAGSLERREVRSMHGAVKKVLRLAISNCGTTFSGFQDTRGRAGFFQHLLSVYGRAGKACPACGEKIQRIIQQQRSTFLCPACQK